MPYLEYLMWQAWLEEEWNHPSRTDHYLMLIDQRIKHVLSKKKSINPADSKIPFKRRESEPVTPKTKSEKETKAFVAVLGGKAEYKTLKRSELPKPRLAKRHHGD